MIRRSTASIHHRDRGWALVVSMVVMSLLLGLGIATLAIVDTQQQESRKQRVRESSFNLAEGMLYGASQILARNWPSDTTTAFPQTCTEASTDALCTSPASVTAATGATNPIFAGTDFSGTGNVTWRVRVRDNGNFSGTALTNYDQATADGVQRRCSVEGTAVAACAGAGGTVETCNVLPNGCTYDFNSDEQVFVRAEATVRGRTRRLVALLRLELRQLRFNSNVVQSAWLESTNNGTNKTLVDAQPTGVTSGSTVVLTCAQGDANCPDPEMLSQQKNQMNPPNSFVNGQTVPTGLSEADYQGVLTSGLAKVYNDATGCPGQTNELAWTGYVILDFASGTNNCTLQSNAQVNSPSNPGFLIINRGKVTFLGTMNFFGIVYARNLTNETTGLVDLGGGGSIQGSVTVDGPGGVIVGGKEGSVIFDPNAGPKLKTTGAAGLVQSTWRELDPNQ